MNKAEALDKIRCNITNFGHHIYVVAGGPNPRFSYSVGLSEVIGAEVIMAGSSFYSIDEVGEIINGIAKMLRSNMDWMEVQFLLGSKGRLSLSAVDRSWTSKLILGALDYYNASEVIAFQISPDPEHWTIDVPDLSVPWDAASEPCWQWLEKPWSYPVSKSSVAVTNLDALKGDPVTEVMRWEETEWELFAGSGPDVEQDEIRIVPLGTLLAADASLVSVTSLAAGKGLWRQPGGEWNPWGR